MNNSFKDDLYAHLEGHGVKYINVNRDASINGSPATAIEVYVRDDVKHEFSFAKSNAMNAKNMADVIKSYLRNRT